MIGSQKLRITHLVAGLAIAFLWGSTAPAQTGAEDTEVQGHPVEGRSERQSRHAVTGCHVGQSYWRSIGSSNEALFHAGNG